MCHLNLYVKKWGSPSSFRRKRPFISLNNSAFIENLSSSEGARARARANHAKNNAQKGCVMQLNGITLMAELSQPQKRMPFRTQNYIISIAHVACSLMNETSVLTVSSVSLPMMVSLVKLWKSSTGGVFALCLHGCSGRVQ